MTHSDYETIRTTLKETGGNVSKTAKILRRNRQLITKAVTTGWPALGLPPLSPRAAAAPAPTTPAAAPATKEQQAISTQISNLLGNSIAVSRALAKLVDSAPLVLAKIAEDGAISPADYVKFVRELGKTQAQTSSALAALMAASRLSEGRAQTISEVQHSGSVGVEVGVHVEPSAASAESRIVELLDIHRRTRAYVPGQYRGEERGIAERAEPIDVEATEAVG
jgi:hypothetical protein